MNATKQCSRCKITKPTYEFNHDSYSTDGFYHKCKACNVKHTKEWVNNNREYYNEQARIRIATNPQHKISRNMHHRLWNILRHGCYSTRTEQIIGLNKQTYLEWLSYNFEGEMTWANYGKMWEIDLIIPASAFDLTTEEGLLSCFNWKNIRPCLKSDNAAKYNFILPLIQANQSIRVLGFIRKMQQIKLEDFLNKFE